MATSKESRKQHPTNTSIVSQLKTIIRQFAMDTAFTATVHFSSGQGTIRQIQREWE